MIILKIHIKLVLPETAGFKKQISANKLLVLPKIQKRKDVFGERNNPFYKTKDNDYSLDKMNKKVVHLDGYNKIWTHSSQ